MPATGRASWDAGPHVCTRPRLSSFKGYCRSTHHCHMALILVDSTSEAANLLGIPSIHAALKSTVTFKNP
jgi:hypothetical protein